MPGLRNWKRKRYFNVRLTHLKDVSHTEVCDKEVALSQQTSTAKLMEGNISTASVVTGAIGLAGAFLAAAYALLLTRITKIEDRHDKEAVALWGEMGNIRRDLNQLASTVVTKDDLRHTENRIAALIKAGGHAD